MLNSKIIDTFKDKSLTLKRVFKPSGNKKFSRLEDIYNVCYKGKESVKYFV